MEAMRSCNRDLSDGEVVTSESEKTLKVPKVSFSINKSPDSISNVKDKIVWDANDEIKSMSMEKSEKKKESGSRKHKKVEKRHKKDREEVSKKHRKSESSNLRSRNRSRSADRNSKIRNPDVNRKNRRRSDSGEDRKSRRRSDSGEDRKSRRRSDSGENRNSKIRNPDSNRKGRRRSDSDENRKGRRRSDSDENRKGRRRSDSDENRNSKIRNPDLNRKGRYRSDSDENRKGRRRSDSRENRQSRRRSDSDENRKGRRDSVEYRISLKRRNGHDKFAKSRESHRRARELDRYLERSKRSNNLDSSENGCDLKKGSRRSRKREQKVKEPSSDNDDTNFDDLLCDMDIDEDALVQKRREERKERLEKIKKPEICNHASEDGVCEKINSFEGISLENSSVSNAAAEMHINDHFNLAADDISPVAGNVGIMKAEIFNENNEYDEKRFLTHGKKFWEDGVEQDDFDMFREDEVDIKLFNRVLHLKGAGGAAQKNGEKELYDTWDDNEGYYKVQMGEVLAEKYCVFGSCGKGVFSTVIRARDVEDENKVVSIKMIRNNDLMLRQGRKELEAMRLLNDADPANKYHCMRLYDHFYYRNHLCLVLEPMYINLRELVRKYGNGIGININAVRSYSIQLFQALKHLRRHKLIHADIKPDNIMINTQKSQIKLGDFGSVQYEYEVEVTPYMVSRFYRAPEIILGLKYDYAIDLWSLACSIYELFTGKILFSGNNNNNMIKLMMDVKGKFTHKLLRRASFTYDYFDENLNFLHKEQSKIMEREKITLVNNVKAVTDVWKLLLKDQTTTGDEGKHISNFADMLDKMLTLDPAKRSTPWQCLQHPFILEK